MALRQEFPRRPGNPALGCLVLGRPLAQLLQRWPGWCNSAGLVTVTGISTPDATLHIDFIHSAFASGRPTWTVQKEFAIATLATFLCCYQIWTGEMLLPSSLLEFESFLKAQVA